MKHKIRNAVKWLACGILAVLVSSVCFNIQSVYDLRLPYMIYGTGLIAIVCFAMSIVSLLDQKNGTGKAIGTMIIEDVVPHTEKGCTVVGDVQGTMAVGAKVTVTDQSGQSFQTTIKQMEQFENTVEAVTDSPVALILKHVSPDDVCKGDVVRYEA